MSSATVLEKLCVFYRTEDKELIAHMKKDYW